LQSLRAQPPQMFDRFNAGPKEPSGREAGR